MAFTEGSDDGVLNGATEEEIVPAPAASTRRLVKNITICNVDTVANEVLVYVKSAGGNRFLCKITLAVKDSLVFGEEDYIVLDATTKSVCAKMSGAHTTTAPDWNSCWADAS